MQQTNNQHFGRWQKRNKKTNLSKKNLTALEFWRNVYVCCGGCREEKILKTKFIMDFAKVTKKSLHLQR